jgi:hypothetical protein
MGSDPTKDPAARTDETPQHPVYLDAYWIARTPQEKEMIQRENPCGVPS